MSSQQTEISQNMFTESSSSEEEEDENHPQSGDERQYNKETSQGSQIRERKKMSIKSRSRSRDAKKIQELEGEKKEMEKRLEKSRSTDAKTIEKLQIRKSSNFCQIIGVFLKIIVIFLAVTVFTAVIVAHLEDNDTVKEEDSQPNPTQEEQETQPIPTPEEQELDMQMKKVEKAKVTSEGSSSLDKKTQLSGITITNDLSQGDLSDIEIYSVISEKVASTFSYVTNWRYVDVEKNQKEGLWQSRQIVTSSCRIPSHGGQEKLKCSLRFHEDYRHYWQFKCRIDGKSYRINKNNAQANVWDMDNGKIPRFILLEEGDYVRINMMFNSGTAHFYLEEY